MKGEKLLSLAEAAKWLETELGVKRRKAALWAWLTYGIYGVRLEAVSVAGKWYTTISAMKRFFEAVTRTHNSGYVNPLEVG